VNEILWTAARIIVYSANMCGPVIKLIYFPSLVTGRPCSLSKKRVIELGSDKVMTFSAGSATYINGRCVT